MDSKFKKHLAEIAQYMQECGVDIYPYPRVMLNKQPQVSDYLEAPTGYYDPQKKLIMLYIHGRHPKDILRSYAHELIHHHQNLNGLMTPDTVGESDPKYAQNNPRMRRLEKDAYQRGNIIFRDYTDNKKYGK
jgi:hypothetical protein